MALWVTNASGTCWSVKDIISVFVAILVVIGICVGLYNIPSDTAEEKERMRQLTDFNYKCFAVRGRQYYNPETKEHECYNGPQLTFAKRILEVTK